MVRNPACKVDFLPVESRALRGNPLGDPWRRELPVVLPPGFDPSGRRRYPVIWVLAGYYGTGRMALNRNFSYPAIDERLERLVNLRKMPPAILALPDCMTKLGGSQYLDSPATGNYETHVCEELIPLVDAAYPTIATRGGRGVLGKSSGGYGALRLGMRRPDLFSAVASHSGDCYFEYCHMKDFPLTVNAIVGAGGVEQLIERTLATEKPKHDDTLALLNISMGACYSPNARSRRGYDLPFDIRTGEVDRRVMDRWFANDPARMIEKPANARALKSLKLLFLDCGIRDQWALHLGLRIFTAKLKRRKIKFVHEEFDDDHMSISYRYDRSIPLMARALCEH
ncbi:MAG: esterase [Planctomycetes bacterium]|nr:esterase [Planctomycetota bacterium]